MKVKLVRYIGSGDCKIAVISDDPWDINEDHLLVYLDISEDNFNSYIEIAEYKKKTYEMSKTVKTDGNPRVEIIIKERYIRVGGKINKTKQ